MINYAPLIADGIVLVILLIALIRGYTQGFVRILAVSLSALLALIPAYLLYPYVTGYLADSGIRAQLISNLENTFTAALPSTASTSSLLTDSTGAASMLETLGLPNVLQQMVLNSQSADVYEALGVNSFIEYTATYLVDTMLNAVSMVLLYIIFFILIKLVAKSLKFINKIPVIGGINRLLGMALSVVVALVVIELIMYLITSLSGAIEALQPAAKAIEAGTLSGFVQENNHIITWMASYAKQLVAKE